MYQQHGTHTFERLCVCVLCACACACVCAQDPFRSFVSVTQQGGTPQYMAPEQFNGTRVDEKCDVYALACIMYELVSGVCVCICMCVCVLLASPSGSTRPVAHLDVPELHAHVRVR